MATKFLLMVVFISLAICSACQTNKNIGNKVNKSLRSEFKVTVSTIAGKAGEDGVADGRGEAARFSQPKKMCFNGYDNKLYIVDHIAIRSIDQNNAVATYMGREQLSVWDEIYDIAPGEGPGILYFTTKYDGLYKTEPRGNTIAVTQVTQGEGNSYGPLNANDHLDGAYGVALGLNGDVAVYNTYWACLNRIKITSMQPVSGIVENWAGKPTTQSLGQHWSFKDGKGMEATFGSVNDIASDGNGNVYLADDDNALIRKVSPDGIVTSIPLCSDDDGDLWMGIIKAQGISHLDVTKDGKYIVVVIPGFGYSSPLIRLVQPGKPPKSLTGFHHGYKDGPGEDAAFGGVAGIAITPDGKTIYLSEEYARVIRKITLQ